MFKIKNTGALLLIAAALWLLGACRPSTELLAQPDKDVPAHFRAGRPADTAGLSRRMIFSDSLLVRLIDTAVRANKDVLVAHHRTEAARAHFRMSKAALLPSVSLEATAAAQRYGDYTMEGVGNFDTNLSGNINEDQKAPVPLTPNYFLGLRSSWEIDLWGKLKSRKKAALMRLLATERGKDAVITSLVAEVAARYYELIALDAELDIIRKNIRLQEKAVELTTIQKEGGRATELAVQQFSAQLLRTTSLEAQAEQNILRVENEINFLLGRYPQPITRSSAFPEQLLPGGAQAGLPVSVLWQRPDVQQAEAELKAADADVLAARAAFMPALTLTPFAGYNAFNASLLFRPGSLAYGVVGGLAGPLVNRGQVKGEHRKAKAERMQAWHLYHRSILNAFGEISTHLSNLEKLQEVHTLNTREALLLTDAVGTANDLYLAGYASYLEVITAQKSAVEAELNLVNTRKNMFHTLISLYRSAGGGWD